MRIEAVRFLRIERQRLYCRVAFLDVNIRTALLRKLRKLRFFFNHLEEVIVNDVRLLQLRRKAINLCPVFAVKICHIRDHGGSEKRFAVFPPDHNKHFAEYPHVIFVNYPEDQRYRRFLP